METIKGYWDSLTGYRYFKEIAFLVALLLILGAWKFGIEGITD